MGTATSKLKDLARRAGRWLGLAEAAPAPAHTTAIVADRFDAMSWRDTLAQATALRELADELAETFDYSSDLLADVFLGAYKADPQVRTQAEMDPSRLVNHGVITALLASPEFGELRRQTAGDPYAAAMAVLAQADGLRRMIDHARQAHNMIGGPPAVMFEDPADQRKADQGAERDGCRQRGERDRAALEVERVRDE